MSNDTPHKTSCFLSGEHWTGRVRLELSKGEVVGERFTIRRLLGRGGMADVYQAHDSIRKQDLAIKIFAAQSKKDVPLLVEAARSELSAQSGVKDFSSILQVSDIFQCTWDALQLIVLSMECADGGSLRQRLDGLREKVAERRKMGPHWIMEICSGLEELLQNGSCHLDVKPENALFVSGEVKICDAGLGKFWLGQASNSTGEPTQTVFGTFDYMSPEGFGGKGWGAPDARSDVYSLGVMLHEMLQPTGKRPFKGDIKQLKLKHQNSKPPQLRSVPKDLRDIVTTCLAKKPEERFADAGALREALASVLYNGNGRPPGQRATVPINSAAPPATTAGSQESMSVVVAKEQAEAVGMFHEYVDDQNDSRELESRELIVDELERLYPSDPRTLFERLKTLDARATLDRRMETLPLALRHYDWPFIMRLVRDARAISPGSPIFERCEKALVDVMEQQELLLEAMVNSSRANQVQALDEFHAKQGNYAVGYIRELLGLPEEEEKK